MYAAIVFLPLLGCLIAGLFGRVIGPRPSELVTTGLLLLSAALSVVAFATVAMGGGATQIITLVPWVHSGSFVADWTIRVDTITAVMLPEGHDADKFRAQALETFNISYGASFGAYAGKYFRIGHLADINDGTLVGALAITEMALQLAGVPIKKGGVQAAMDYLVTAHGGGAKKAAAE